MTAFWIAFVIVGGSALLSVAIIWLRFREFWTPGLPRVQAGRFASEQNRLRLGESFLSREVLHPFLGYVLNPAAGEEIWKSCDFKRPPINSFGLPSPFAELPRRSPGKAVVAVFGGSVAAFLTSDHKDALAAALSATGAFAGKQIEIHCFAVHGYKQPQQLASLAYFRSLGAEFDLVISLDGFNEIALHPAENAFKGICYSFPRAWATRAATRVDPALVFLFGQLAVHQARRGEIWKYLQRAWVRFLPQVYLVGRIMDARLRSKRSRVMKSIRQFHPPTEENLNSILRDDDGMYPQLARLWAQCSEMMHQLCSAAGAKYVLCLQPNQYVPESKPLTAEEKATAFDPNHPYRVPVQRGYPELKSEGQLLVQRGVAFVDATMLFATCNETVYGDRCCHFNQRGNEMIAATIAAEVARIHEIT